VTSGPRYHWEPDGRVGSYVDEVAAVAEMLHRPLDPHGLIAVDVMTAYGHGGRWLTLEAVLKLPRQSGKTKGIMLPIALTASTIFPAMPRVWTAHREDAYLEAFDLAKILIEGSEEFSRRVLRISEADGNKRIDFTNGSSLLFAVRSAKFGRSKGIPEHFHDEALWFKADHAGAMLPTVAAQPNPRIWYFSSGATAASDGDYLRALTARGRLGGDPSLVYLEWCASGGWGKPGCEQRDCEHFPGTQGCALDNRDLWREAIPTLGGRTSEEVIEGMRRSMAKVPRIFGREFLGWDEEGEAESRRPPITPDAWAALADPGMERPEELHAVAVDVSPGFRMGAIAGATRLPDGRTYLSLVEHRYGAAWIRERMSDLRDRYGLTRVALSPVVAGSLILEFQADGWEIDGLSLRDATSATGGLHRAISEAAVVHRGDPIVSSALWCARRRDVGSERGWVWTRDTADRDTDISPIVAITEALWGLAKAEADPAGELMAFWR